MANSSKPPRRFDPRWWRMIVQLLVYLAFVVALYSVLVGLGTLDIPPNRSWIAAMLIAGLIIIPIVYNLTEFAITKSGITTKFDQMQQEYKERVEEYQDVDPEVIAQALKDLDKARTDEDLETSLSNVLMMNTTGNLQRVKEAIENKKKIFVRYRPLGEAVAKIHFVVPVDLKPGATANTLYKDYLHIFSEQDSIFKTFRWDGVQKVEISAEDFDPKDIPGIKDLAKDFNFERDWEI